MALRRNRSDRYQSDKTYVQAHKDDPDRRFLRSRDWRDRIRPAQLRREPLCRHCRALGKLVYAQEVDHIVPARGDMQLLRDPANFQSLCKFHHGLKTRGVKVIGIDAVSGWTIEAGEVPKILGEQLETVGEAHLS
jgi:5-methylcytosine-specific restriction enzyme A